MSDDTTVFKLEDKSQFPKTVPLVIYKEGERHIIGEATIDFDDNGILVTSKAMIKTDYIPQYIPFPDEVCLPD